MVERNGLDYAAYLNGVFRDDPDFQQAADNWAAEEVQHGDALGQWAMLADPGWDYAAAFARYREGFRIDTAANASIRGSRTGELIARCMVETGTSSYYTAVGRGGRGAGAGADLPADRRRRVPPFQAVLRPHAALPRAREPRNVCSACASPPGRISETEDDELAFAFHCANGAPGLAYEHEACLAAYLSRAIQFYRFRHVERGMGMIFKAVGLPPRGRLSDISARLAWQLLQRRQRRFAERVAAPADFAAAA